MTTTNTIDIKNLKHTLNFDISGPIVYTLHPTCSYLIFEKEQKDELMNLILSYFNSLNPEIPPAIMEDWIKFMGETVSLKFPAYFLDCLVKWYCFCCHHLWHLNDSRIILSNDEGEADVYKLSELPTMEELKSKIDEFSWEELKIYLEIIEEEINKWAEHPGSYEFTLTTSLSIHQFSTTCYELAKQSEKPSFENRKETVSTVKNLREWYGKDPNNNWRTGCKHSENLGCSGKMFKRDNDVERRARINDRLKKMSNNQ